eukprot:4721245-Pyramimonas_sp.AAC.1
MLPAAAGSVVTIRVTKVTIMSLRRDDDVRFLHTARKRVTRKRPRLGGVDLRDCGTHATTGERGIIETAPDLAALGGVRRHGLALCVAHLHVQQHERAPGRAHLPAMQNVYYSSQHYIPALHPSITSQ